MRTPSPACLRWTAGLRGPFACPHPPGAVGYGMPIPMTPGLVAELERAELRAWSAVYRNAPPAAVVACGIGIREFPSAAAMWMSKIDVPTCNRVIGLGLDGPPERKTVEEIVTSYEQAMVPQFFLQLAPIVTVGPTITVVEDVGFARHNNWTCLVRDVSSPGPVPTDLRVEEIGTDHATAYGEVLCAGYGWPPELGLLVAAMVGAPGWKFYLAFAEERPVGTAALMRSGRVGWMGLDTTLPAARGLGCQSALIARRILDARTAGCEVVSVETAEQAAEQEAPSYRNVLRAGFEVGYLRPNYIYQFQQRDEA